MVKIVPTLDKIGKWIHAILRLICSRFKMLFYAFYHNLLLNRFIKLDKNEHSHTRSDLYWAII